MHIGMGQGDKGACDFMGKAGCLPGVAHDLGNADAMCWVWGEEPFQEVLASIAGPPGGLVLAGHNARKELLEPLEVVAAVVASFGKWQHGCAQHRCFVPIQGAEVKSPMQAKAQLSQDAYNADGLQQLHLPLIYAGPVQ